MLSFSTVHTCTDWRLLTFSCCCDCVQSTPIFGSASTFGAGSGFGGFSGLSNAAKTEDEKKDDDDDEAAPEEECAAEFKPVVQLDEVEVATGEEDEECLLDIKCKLYRFISDSNEWKERGVGQARILQHKENKRSRFLMRQEKTLKIRGNHVIMPGTKVQEHSGNEKAVVFNCVDFADEEQKPELFCIRFASAERAKEFREAYEAAAERNEPLIARATETIESAEKDASEADKVADDLAKAEVNKD